MARGFNSTGFARGVGTTDLIATGLTANPVQRSFFCWFWEDGDGGGGLGRIFDQDASNGSVLFNSATGPTLHFDVGFSTTPSDWTVVRPSLSAWHSIGIAYDGSSVANKPTIYIDGVSVTVTTLTAPVGTFIGGVASLSIGNRAATFTSNRCWEGMIAEFAVWDSVLLTAGEFAALAKGVRAYHIRPASMSLYMPLDGLQSPEPDLSGFARNGTLTGTKIQPGPPLAPFTPRWPQFNFSPPPPPADVIFGDTLVRPQWRPAWY